MKNFKPTKRIVAFILTLIIALTIIPFSAFASTGNEVSITTNLVDGATQKGSKKTFDVYAKDENGNKIASAVTLNGSPVSINWDDLMKTSYTLNLTKQGENTVVVSAGSKSISYTINYVKAQEGDLIGYATWSIEALTIGRGFIELPVKVPIYEGENSAQALDRLLTNFGYSYDCTGRLESGFYLATIADGGCSDFSNGCQDESIGKKINVPFDPTNDIPAPLYDALSDNGAIPLEEPLYSEDEVPYGLGEFDYTYMSGWMYCVNTVFPNVGFSDTYLCDGDVLRLQFTMYGYGADIGGGYAVGAENPNYYPIADKDQLLSEIATINSSENKEAILSDKDVKESFDEAVRVASKLEAEQSEVNDVRLNLQNALDTYNSKPSAPFTKIQLENGTELKSISQSTISVDPWETGTSTQVPLFDVVVPENTDKVNILLPAGADISQYCAWMDRATNTYPFENEEDKDYVLAKLDDDSYMLTVTIDKTNDDFPDVFIMEDTCYDFTNAITFTVEGTDGYVPAEGVTLDHTDEQIENGQTLQLKATVTPQNTTNKNIKWTSTDKSIVSVDVNGLVTANGAGDAAITATTSDGSFKSTCNFNVKEKPPIDVKINVTPSDATIFLQDSNNNRILPKNGSYSLTPGATYYYTITKKGYKTASDSFIVKDTSLNIALLKAETNSTIKPQMPSYWPSFRGNPENNGVVSAKIPKIADEATLYWATKKGNGFGTNAIGSPIIVDDYLVFCSGKELYKMNRFTGEILEKTGKMVGTSNYNIIPPAYADGIIYVGLANGTIQAFNADTLESLWVYNDKLKGQPNSPIVCHNGYLYTGFWNSETKNANFVCLSTTDEDITKTDETKKASWTYTKQGGFYWAGAYVNDDYVLVGTDDGKSGYLSDTSSLLSIDPKSGALLDKIDNLNGDIRSSVSYDKVTDRYYFTSKGGSFYSVALNKDGTFKKDGSSATGYDLKEIELDNLSDSTSTPPMSTSTPVINNGRAYIGVSGTSQFGSYSGHNITVIDLQSFNIAYIARTKGYPQTSGLLTTAYQDEDGYSYIYFIDNYTPGQVRVLKDKPGVTSVVDGVTEKYNDKGTEVVLTNCAPVLFTPSGSQAQYAICSPIVDEYGTMYFKNDSSQMMALGSKVTGISVTTPPTKTVYKAGETFDKTGMVVTATFANGLTRDVTNYVDILDNQLTTDDIDVTIYYNHVMYGDKLDKDNGNQINVAVNAKETYQGIFVLTENQVINAETVTKMINSIGDVTVDSGKLIKEARTAYEALDCDIQDVIPNVATLSAAEKEYTTIRNVYDLISDLGTISYSKGDNITKAQSAYDYLSSDQKKKITNFAILQSANTQLKAINNEINMVIEKINGLKDITIKSENDVNSTRELYDKLPEDSKVAVTNITNLVNSENTISSFKKQVKDVEDAISSIGDVSYSKIGKIEDILNLYNQLSPDLQELISNSDVMFSAKESAKIIVDNIQTVKDKIDSLQGLVSDEATIKEIRNLYDSLPEDSKAMVNNISILEDAEKTQAGHSNKDNVSEPQNDETIPKTGSKNPDLLVVTMLFSAAFAVALKKTKR